MISMTTALAQPLPFWRTPLEGRAKSAEERSPGLGLPSLSDMRDAQKSMKKEMAARKVQAVRERREALMLMVKIDPKAALKMTAELAKALKSAVKDYVDAGGKNVTDGEMAMMRRDAKDARAAADGSLEALPAEPKDVEIADVEVDAPAEAEAANVDAETSGRRPPTAPPSRSPTGATRRRIGPRPWSARPQLTKASSSR